MPETLVHGCPESFYEQFDRKEGDPHTTHYCPGCGHGLVHKYIAEALSDFGVRDRSILVSPVGCAVFAYYYFDVGNVQAAHGRSPAVATGVKRAHPGSIVIGYQGDGDLAAIGGNEIVHAANRGENLSIFFVNNAIYGMTGGQMAPTTLLGMKTSTTPLGRRAENEGFPIRVLELLNALDAPYYLERVAVGDVKHNHKARKAVRKAIQNQIDEKGFSLVEILSPCPTGWNVAPVDAAHWTLEEMTKVFPLGVVRDGHALELGHPRLRVEPERERIHELLNLSKDVSTPVPAGAGTAPVEGRFKISGFGGQGVLLLGVVLAQAGMLAGRKVSWMPSYGPEMRGGTAYCDVTLSSEEIGSPVIARPTVLVAMNGPSVERFAGDVEPGGSIYYNSSLVRELPQRRDVRLVPVPAAEIADRLGNPKVANLVMLGAILGRNEGPAREPVLAALKTVLKSRAHLFELNCKAIDAGVEAVGSAMIPSRVV